MGCRGERVMSEKAVQFNAYEDMRTLAEAVDDVLSASYTASSTNVGWRAAAEKLHQILTEVDTGSSVRGIHLGAVLASAADRTRLREIIRSLEGPAAAAQSYAELELLAQAI